MPNKTLLIVSALYPPVISSGIHRIVRLSRYLSELGVNIFILTLDEKTLPKSFKYDHEIMAKIPESIKIYRIPAIQLLKNIIDLKNRNRGDGQISENKSALAKDTFTPNTLPQKKSGFQKLKDTITYNLNTPDNYAMWIYPAVKAGVKIIHEHGIQNVFSSSPPGSSHVVSYHIKRRTGARWIADFRDPWAQKRWFNPEMTPFKQKKIRKFERQTVQNADTIIMNTPELLADFQSHYGDSIHKKSIAIMNGFDPADFIDLPATNGRIPDEIVICHTGTFYRQRSPMPFLTGMRDAFNSGQVPRKRFKVKFIGGVGHFASELHTFLAENNMSDVVEIIPQIPHRQCLAEIMRADVLLIVQPVTKVQIPAKIFEYIATRKPIFSISAAGATANVVLENNLGWWAKFDDTREIAQKVTEIHHFFASGAAKNWRVDDCILEKFNGKKLVEKIYDYMIG